MSETTTPSTLSEAAKPASAKPNAEPKPKPKFNVDWIRRYGVYGAIVLLIAINVVITNNYLTMDNLWTQLQAVAPIVILALGMALVIGTGGIDLSVGSVMALSASIMPHYLGYGTLPSILMGMLIGLAAGAIAGILVAKVNLQPIVATLGVMVAGRGLSAVITPQINFTDPGLKALGTDRVLGMPYIVLVAIVITLIMGFVVKRTVFGRRYLPLAETAGLRSSLVFPWRAR